jgi:hypothetical protein
LLHLSLFDVPVGHAAFAVVLVPKRPQSPGSCTLNVGKTGKGQQLARGSDGMDATERAQWTFGRLLKWHLVRGTRPGGRIDKSGERWVAKEFGEKAGRVSDRAVRHWLKDEHLPQDISSVENALFGSAGYDDWRLELRLAHARGSEANIAEVAPAATSVPSEEHSLALATSHPSGIQIEQTSIRLPLLQRRDALERSRPKCVPMMAPKPPADFVGRPYEFDAVKERLLDRKGDAVIAITAALKGAGGYGKTTLAKKLAHDTEIRCTAARF